MKGPAGCRSGRSLHRRGRERGEPTSRQWPRRCSRPRSSLQAKSTCRRWHATRPGPGRPRRASSLGGRPPAAGARWEGAAGRGRRRALCRHYLSREAGQVPPTGPRKGMEEGAYGRQSWPWLPESAERRAKHLNRNSCAVSMYRCDNSRPQRTQGGANEGERQQEAPESRPAREKRRGAMRRRRKGRSAGGRSRRESRGTEKRQAEQRARGKGTKE